MTDSYCTEKATSDNLNQQEITREDAEAARGAAQGTLQHGDQFAEGAQVDWPSGARRRCLFDLFVIGATG